MILRKPDSGPAVMVAKGKVFRGAGGWRGVVGAVVQWDDIWLWFWLPELPLFLTIFQAWGFRSLSNFRSIFKIILWGGKAGVIILIRARKLKLWKDRWFAGDLKLVSGISRVGSKSKTGLSTLPTNSLFIKIGSSGSLLHVAKWREVLETIAYSRHGFLELCRSLTKN